MQLTRLRCVRLPQICYDFPPRGRVFDHRLITDPPERAALVVPGGAAFEQDAAPDAMGRQPKRGFLRHGSTAIVAGRIHPTESSSNMQLTREIAHAAATDAGNRSMRRAGRTAWNEDDYNAACDEFSRLWPTESK